jgi:phage-related holin
MEWITNMVGDLNSPLTANQLIAGYIIYHTIKISQTLVDVGFKMYKNIKKDMSQ